MPNQIASRSLRLAISFVSNCTGYSSLLVYLFMQPLASGISCTYRVISSNAKFSPEQRRTEVAAAAAVKHYLSIWMETGVGQKKERGRVVFLCRNYIIPFAQEQHSYKCTLRWSLLQIQETHNNKLSIYLFQCNWNCLPFEMMLLLWFLLWRRIVVALSCLVGIPAHLLFRWLLLHQNVSKYFTETYARTHKQLLDLCAPNQMDRVTQQPHTQVEVP